jgi:hypothetical protein
MVVVAQNTAYDILIDLNAERQSDLLCNSWATPVRIAALHLDDGVDEFCPTALLVRVCVSVLAKTAADIFLSQECCGNEEESTLSTRLQNGSRVLDASELRINLR